MTHAQKPDLVFQRNGRVHLNWQGCQFSRLLAVEEYGSAVCDCIDRVPMYSARLLATHSIRIFPLHFPSRASPCAIRFRTHYTNIPRCICHNVKTFRPYHLQLPHVGMCSRSSESAYRVHQRINGLFIKQNTITDM